MNFWQRGLKSVTRRKGRSFILFLVIFILGNVIAGAVSIQQSTKNVEIETKKQMGAQATIDMDYEQFDKDYNANPEKFEDDSEWFSAPSLKELEAVGQLPYVKFFDYSIPGYMGTNKVKAYSPEDGSVSYGGAAKYQFNLKGVNRKEIVDAEEGYIKIVEGSTFSDKDITDGTQHVIISKEVAELNNLSVGDQLVFDVTGEYYNEEDMMREDEGTDEGEMTDNEGLNEPEVITFDFPTEVVGDF